VIKKKEAMLRNWWILGALAAAVALAQNGAMTGRVDFGRHVRPILSDNCFACHGPDEKNRMANLRLDDRESAMRVIAAGKRNASKLFERISHSNTTLRMPPAAFERKPTRDQIELIGKWIDEGAAWTTHWSYTAPRRPDAPSVANRIWARNPIDHFVMARREKEGLKRTAPR
jgi:mono/diheme cytochrome c family protein